MRSSARGNYPRDKDKRLSLIDLRMRYQLGLNSITQVKIIIRERKIHRFCEHLQPKAWTPNREYPEQIPAVAIRSFRLSSVSTPRLNLEVRMGYPFVRSLNERYPKYSIDTIRLIAESRQTQR
jgi:hypothetical protein